VTTIAPSWAALIASAIVAAVGGFGIFMFIVLTSVSGCLN